MSIKKIIKYPKKTLTNNTLENIEEIAEISCHESSSDRQNVE